MIRRLNRALFVVGMLLAACDGSSDEDRARAVALFDEGVEVAPRDPEQAIARLEEAIQADPDFVEAQYQLALLQLANRTNVEAPRRALLAILAIEPKHAAALAKLGEIEFDQGEFEAAEAHLEKAVHEDETAFFTWMTLGKVRDRLERTEGALEAFRRASAIADRPGPHFWQGLVLRRAGRLEESARAFRRAIELEPAHPSAYHQLGRALRELGDDAAADRATEIHELLQDLTGDIRSRFELPQLIERHDSALRVLELVPGAGRIEIILGDTYLQLAEEAGQAAASSQALRQAEAAYLRAIESTLDEIMGRVRLRALYQETGRVEQAVKITEELESIRARPSGRSAIEGEEDQ